MYDKSKEKLLLHMALNCILLDIEIQAKYQMKIIRIFTGLCIMCANLKNSSIQYKNKYSRVELHERLQFV